MEMLWLWPIVVYAFVTGFTPGPNNMMLLASGTNFGFRRTVPHMLGITVGFTLIQLAVGFGLGEVFKALPWLHTILRFASFAFLLYLAYKIAISGKPSDQVERRAKPISFWGAVAFQVINPKAIIVIVGFFSTYLPANPPISMLLIGIAVMSFVAWLSTLAWTEMGVVVQRYLQHPVANRAFNWTMAVLLVVSMVPVLFES